MNDILFASASEAARSLRDKEISARELLELLFARIDEVEPAINAIVEQRRDVAVAELVHVDEALARGDSAPLLGVPMTIKESFHVAGMRTTWGLPDSRDYVPDWSATVVRRLGDAGASIVGKTNVPLFLADWQSFNDIHGVTRNPWNLDLTPGGSTGGAAALAAGETFLEYGSDLVGSIRVPASFSGVYGLKPSAGIVPGLGMQPPGSLPGEPINLAYMTFSGPLARTAGDLRIALRATAGPDEPDSRAYAWSLPAARHRRLRDFRVGLVLDDDHSPVTGEVRTVLGNAVDALRAAGVSIVEGWPDGVDPGSSHETFGYHVGLFNAYHGAEFEGIADYLTQERRRMELRSAWARYFREVDVFVCPTTFTTAFPHDHRPIAERTIPTTEGDRPYDLSFWIGHASIAGLPALSAPAGRTAAGLPVGLQVIGPRYEDDTAITFAELLADVVGGYERPPL